MTPAPKPILAAGDKLGPYEIVGPVGRGGMGEVYKAYDARLDRIVALKVSKQEFFERFEREARAAAALNHPHIATLHDVGPDYLVMEFVEGETLRGPLPVARALLYSRQILAALAAAHRGGIVHCDLKPGNIMVSKQGVKLLDFGLARLREKVKASGETATMVMPADGAISGTLQYLSPEQLQGKPPDARSDIFAFGLVLYEMLAGRRAFDGDNTASVITAIMTAEPPPLPAGTVPPALEKVIRRCLTKDPDDRWQSAADISHALDLIEQPGARDDAPSRWRFAVWSAAGIIVLVALLTLALIRFRGSAAPAAWSFRPITYSGRASWPVLSPDGKQVVFFQSGDSANPPGLYVQLISGGNPLRLPVDGVRGRAAWSADGSRIAFATKSGLYVMPALGGTPQRIAAFPEGQAALNVAWAPGGGFFVVDGLGSGLSVISAEGGEFKPLTKPAGADRSPAISPDGRTLAFARRVSFFNIDVRLLPLNRDGSAAGPDRPITTSDWTIGSVTWTASGDGVLFDGYAGSNSSSVWRIPRGGGVPVRLDTPSGASDWPTVSPTGRMVYVSTEYETKIFKGMLGPHAPSEPQPLVEAIGDHRDLAVARDGSSIAFISARTGAREVWMAKADGSSQTQLTYFNGPSVGSPSWSPDGKQIAFDAYGNGSSDLYLVAADGGKPVRLTTSPYNEVRPSWSHDGQWIYYGRDRAGHESEIWKIRTSGGESVRVSPHGMQAVETPDGQWLYIADPPKLLRARPDGTQEQLVTDHLAFDLWAIGGGAVYMASQDLGLVRAPFGSDRFETVYQFPAGARPASRGPALAVPSDESYFVYRVVTRNVSTLMLVEGLR